MPNVYEVIGRVHDTDSNGLRYDRYIVVANDLDDIHPMFGPEIKIHYVQMINQPEDKVLIKKECSGACHGK